MIETVKLIFDLGYSVIKKASIFQLKPSEKYYPADPYLSKMAVVPLDYFISQTRALAPKMAASDSFK